MTSSPPLMGLALAIVWLLAAGCVFRRWRPETRLRSLLNVVRYCQRNGMQLVVVVVFLHLLHMEASRGITSKVVDFLNQHHVQTIDVADSLVGRDPPEFMVNPCDVHPNEALHREVAMKLLDVIPQCRLAHRGGI